MNEFYNWSFEEGWEDHPTISAQIPDGWKLDYTEGESTVRIPEKPEQWYRTIAPEIVHSRIADLQPGEPELFGTHGTWTLKIFKFKGAIRTFLRQDRELIPGQRYKVTIPVFVDVYEDWTDDGKIPPNLHDEEAKRAGRLRIWANEQHSEWFDEVSVEDWFLNRHELTWEFVAGEKDTEISFEFYCPWPIQNNGWWVDGVSLEKVEIVKPKCVCPRVDYDRTAVLLWQEFENIIDKIQWRAAASIGTAEKLQTVMHSADDAGIGPLEGRNVIAVNPYKWGEGLKEFFDEYYEGVNYIELNATTPTELVVKLQDKLEEDIAIGQNDPRWKDYDFGEQPGGGTIGAEGCFVDGLAVLLRKLYKVNIYPHVLDKALVNARSAYISDNLLVWESLASLFSKIEEAKRVSVSEAIELFNDGWEVILRQESPQHFVYVEKFDGDTVHIIDTFDGERKTKPLSNYNSARVARTVYQPAPPDEGPTYEPVEHFTGFQQQRAGINRDEFISTVKPEFWMLLGAYEEASHIKSLSPNTKTVIRYVDNDWRQYLFAEDKMSAARKFIGKFQDSLLANRESIDYILGLNEYIAVNDYETLEHVGPWVKALCLALEELDNPARLVGLNTAVGNPQHDYLCEQQGIPSQVSYLVPAVEALIEHDGLVGYHSYWGTRVTDNGYYCTLGTDDALHYEMRALLSWDAHFVNKGLYPKYLFTEGGPIYIDENGSMPNAYGGWKKPETLNGDVSELVRQYKLFDDIVQEWNSKHGNRARGLAGFIFGSFSEWGPFDVEGEVAMSLAEVL